MSELSKHMKALQEINYDLDFRDLYHFHHDIWITADHVDYVPLQDMSRDHLLNCISMIERQNIRVCFGLGKIWLPKLKKELKSRDEKYE